MQKRPYQPFGRVFGRAKFARCGFVFAALIWLSPASAQTTDAPPQPPPVAHIVAAQDAFNRNAFDAAIAEARLALNDDPRSQQALNILIEALTKAGRETEALNEAERLIGPEESNPVLLSQRGFLRRKANRLDLAFQDFVKAQRSAEATPSQLQNIDAAVAELNAAIIQRDLDAAQAAFDRSDYAQATATAQSVLQREPRSEPATRLLVESQSRSGQVQGALAAADRFIAAGTASSGFRAVRGYIRRKAEDLDGASEDFRIALQDPSIGEDTRRTLAAALAETSSAIEQRMLADAQRALDENRIGVAIERSQKALDHNPSSGLARSILSASLARSNRIREAIAQLDALIQQNPDHSGNYAQRGYYKRRIQDLDGARQDFQEALRLSTNSDEKTTLGKALAEVESAAKAPAAEFDQAEQKARSHVDALIRTKHFREALAAVSALIARGEPKGWMFVQRGLIHRELGEHSKAITDLRRALQNYKLDAPTVINVRFWLVDSRAQVLHERGDVEGALALYREFLAAHPRHADAWYRLAYVLLAEKRINDAGPAFMVAIGMRPTTSAYLDAAGTFILTDAPLASDLYRKGLDGVAVRKSGDLVPPPEEVERIKNEVVKADNSFRMVVGVSGITDRPSTAGGTSVDVGSEATVRFDGRYLPAVEGLEAYTRFYRGQDQTGFIETNADVGVRWRPFRDVDFYVSPAFLQRFTPDQKSQVALNWGLGLGGAAYPYEAKLSASAFDLYWDFAALGSYRTGDRRYLQDFTANLGFTHGARNQYFRSSIGPTALAVASFDSAADGQWALGAGPTLMGRAWFGGDQYRSYDALLQFQVGYVFAIGAVERQQGWRAKVVLYY